MIEESECKDCGEVFADDELDADGLCEDCAEEADGDLDEEDED